MSAAPNPAVNGTGAIAADDLVVGYDGSPSSIDALALATPLARLWRVGVQVVTVHHPVVLGGHRAEDDRELAAARCARDGARRLGGGVPTASGAHRGPDAVTGLHAVAVARAGLVVGRPRHRLTDPGSRRTVVEDAPVAVAVARRGLLPRPRFRHVVLGLADDAPEALDVLRRFAQRLHHHDVAVTVAGLDAAVSSAVLADAVFELGGAVGRRARSAVVPAREAGRRWDGDELLVCVGRPRGAHGHQGPDAVERVLLAQDGPSLLVLPPPSVDVSSPAPTG